MEKKEMIGDIFVSLNHLCFPFPLEFKNISYFVLVIGQLLRAPTSEHILSSRLVPCIIDILSDNFILRAFIVERINQKIESFVNVINRIHLSLFKQSP